ncbi:MAG: AAA family ATPase, partial [Xenococcus sp. (in: cyanobacteria)]
MEKLKVSNFLTLEDIELEIKPINIVIGEQAQGKSVLAKLIYFFKSFWMYYRDSILIDKSEDEFKLQLEKSFTEIFPKYTWEEDNFTIQYKINKYAIEIKNTHIDATHLKSIDKKDNYLTFKYSDILSSLRENIVQKFKQKSNKFYFEKKIIVTSDESIEESFGSHHYLIHLIEEIIFELILKPEDIQEETSSFIPSGRSFFSSIASNI